MKITVITPLGTGFIGLDEAGKPFIEAQDDVKKIIHFEISKVTNERGQIYDDDNFDLVNFYLTMQEKSDISLVPDFEVLNLMAAEDELAIF